MSEIGRNEELFLVLCESSAAVVIDDIITRLAILFYNRDSVSMYKNFIVLPNGSNFSTYLTMLMLIMLSCLNSYVFQLENSIAKLASK